MHRKFFVEIQALSILATGALLVAGGVCLAQTADGSPPSDESVCSVLHDATPALFGLCVAYCEALDCDLISLDGETEAVQCNKHPDPRILELYNRHRREGDPGMPCLSPSPCPCWTTNEIDDIVPVFAPWIDTVCRNDLSFATGGTCAGLNTAFSLCTGVYLSPQGGAIVNNLGSGVFTCYYARGEWGGPGTVSRFHQIDQSTAEICANQLRQQGAAADFSCF